jgi:WD40 repeat protein
MRVEDEQRVTLLTKHRHPVTQVLASPDQVVSVSAGHLRITGPFAFELHRHVGAMAFTPLGLMLGVDLEVMSVTAGVAKAFSSGHRGDVTALVNIDGSSTEALRVVTGSADGVVRWWRHDGSLEGALSTFGAPIQSLSATDDGVLIVSTTHRRLEGWAFPERSVAPDEAGVPSASAWWPKGGLVTGHRDGRLRRFDSESNQYFELEARHAGPVRAVARVGGPEKPQAFRFLSAGDDGRVLAQRWNGGVETLDFVESARVVALATSADGTLAAWAADDGTRVVWNLERNLEVVRIRDTLVRALAFSRDGLRLAVGRDDKHVLVLEAQTGRELQQFPPLDAPVASVAFSPDGELLMAGASDGQVQAWIVRTQQAVHHWFQPHGRVTTLDVSADGKFFAAGSADGNAYVFALQSGEWLGQIPTEGGEVLLVAFTNDSLLVLGQDGIAHHLHL